jgi:hypothetical protein
MGGKSAARRKLDQPVAKEPGNAAPPAEAGSNRDVPIRTSGNSGKRAVKLGISEHLHRCPKISVGMGAGTAVRGRCWHILYLRVMFPHRRP